MSVHSLCSQNQASGPHARLQLLSCLTSPTWPLVSTLWSHCSLVPELPHSALLMPLLCWEPCWLLFLHIFPSAWLLQLFCNNSNRSSIPRDPLFSYSPLYLSIMAVIPDIVIHFTSNLINVWVSIMSWITSTKKKKKGYVDILNLRIWMAFLGNKALADVIH